MQIFIDADGCPVVDSTIRLAVKYGVDCFLLCDTSHFFQRQGAKTIYFSKGSDSVDFGLVNMVQKGDLVITQDYGLAAMCLAKEAVPLHQDGMIYTQDNIGALLQARHTAKRIRRAGGRLKGAAKRTSGQDLAFAAALEELLQNK